MPEPRENPMFVDDVKLITDMLNENWSFGVEDHPIISYDQDTVMANGRDAYIFVYQVSRYNSVSSTDYATLQRNSFVGIRISTMGRDQMYKYMNEVYRIIMDFRRAGPKHLNQYTFMEAVNDHIDNGSLGWYSATIDVKLMNYCFHLKSPGLGHHHHKC